MLESVFKSLPEEEIKDPRFSLQYDRLMLPGGVKRELEAKIKSLKQSRDDSGEVLHLHATPEKISFEKKTPANDRATKSEVKPRKPSLSLFGEKNFLQIMLPDDSRSSSASL